MKKVLMELRSTKGIANDYRFFTIDDVMQFKPFSRIHHGGGEWGDSENAVYVVAVLSDGSEQPLEHRLKETTLTWHQRPEIDVPCIGEQISGLDTVALRGLKVIALRFRGVNRAAHDKRNEEWEELLPIVAPDWSKVRRRVEDALRKSADTAQLYRFAVELGVKVY